MPVTSAPTDTTATSRSASRRESSAGRTAKRPVSARAIAA